MATAKEMTTDREALIEKIVEKTARIIAGHKNDLVTKAAVRAALYNLHRRTAQGGEQSDTVSVPREPTEAMIRAMHKADDDYSNNRFHGNGHLSRAEFVYRAMLAAAKEGKK